MRRGSAGRSLGSGTLSARRRRRGEARSLPPLAVANHRRLRSRPPPGPASLRRVRRLLLLARASHPQAGPRRGEGCLRRRVWTRRRHVLPTSTRTSVSGIILLVSFLRLGLEPLLWCRVGCGAAGCCPDSGGGHFANGGGWCEGCFAGPVVHLLRERRDFVGRRR